MNASITITSTLAAVIGQLSAQHPDSAVTVTWADERDEREWDVTFDDVAHKHHYVVDDEDGSAVLRSVDGTVPT